MIVGRRFSPQAVEAARPAASAASRRKTSTRCWSRLFPHLNRLIADFANSSLAQYYVAQQVKAEKNEQVVDLLQHGLAWAGGEGSRLWVLLGRRRHRQDRLHPPLRLRAGAAGARPDEAAKRRCRC